MVYRKKICANLFRNKISETVSEKATAAEAPLVRLCCSAIFKDLANKKIKPKNQLQRSDQ